MKIRMKNIASALTALSIVSVGATAIAEETLTPEAVARQAIDYFTNCNSDGWLSTRSDDSFMFGIGWKAEGKQEVSQIIQWVVSEFCKNGDNSTVITDIEAVGNLVMFKWIDEVRGLNGVDTLLIENGKIVGQSIADFPLSVVKSSN